MKKIIASLMLAGLFALPAMAQKDGKQHTPEEKATMMTNRMEENLQLSGDQKEAVYKANLEMAQKIEKTRAEAYKENQEKLKKILSEAQYQKMEELRKEKKQNMRKHKHRQMTEDRKAQELKEDPKIE